MKTYEIDYSAPVAVLRESICDRYPIAYVYKVKRVAAFVIAYRRSGDMVFGDAEQTMNYVSNRGLCLQVKNARGRKYLRTIYN